MYLNATNKQNKGLINNLINFINNNKLLCILIISIVGVLIRLVFWDNTSGDYTSFLSKWCDYLRENGGFKAIPSVDTDYNVVYLYFLAFFRIYP